jgi:hypothetical protein
VLSHRGGGGSVQRFTNPGESVAWVIAAACDWTSAKNRKTAWTTLQSIGERHGEVIALHAAQGVAKVRAACLPLHRACASRDAVDVCAVVRAAACDDRSDDELVSFLACLQLCARVSACLRVSTCARCC